VLLSLSEGAQPVIESSLETLARISKDISRESITQFYTNLAQIVAAIDAGDLEKARQYVGLSVHKITGIYGLIFLEAPDWCLPSLRPELDEGIAVLKKQIEDLKQVRAHEKREQLERDAGDPPKRPN
jgi:hypothetical protein